MFVYSRQKCLLCQGGAENLLNKNLARISTNKNERLIFVFSNNYESSSYSFYEDFCKNVAITDLYGDIFCYTLPKPKWDYPYKKLFSKSISTNYIEHVITVELDTTIKLRVKGYNEDVTVNLPFIPTEIQVFNVGTNLILVDLTANLHYLVIIETMGLKVIFADMCNEYDINNTLTLISYINGINKHKRTRIYNYDGDVKLDNETTKSTCLRTYLPNEIIPLAFLEEIKLNADYSGYLCGEALQNKDLIKDFIGEFEFCLPPFYKNLDTTYAIVSRSGVRYAKFTISQNKIADISLEDYY